MPDGKTGGSRWVPDIRPEEIGTFQEKHGDITATYKAVNVHPIINRVLDKLAFFRTHAAAVWYNKLAGQTVADKFGEVDEELSALNANKADWDGTYPNTVKTGISALSDIGEVGIIFTVNSDIPFGSYTLPTYAKGITIGFKNSDMALIAVSPTGKLYCAFRNGREWGSFREI